MASLGLTAATYMDWAKRLDPDGKIAAIVELLNQLNPITQDAAVVEGNLPTGHRTTVRSGLPTATWRMLNYGVQPSKSMTVQITDACGMLETYSQVDKSLADLNGNTASFRLSEDSAFLEAMTQEFCSTFWYGNESTDPAEFTGMSPRYNSLGTVGSQNNVISAGGSSNRSSLWILTWGDRFTHLIFPKGQRAGLHSEDKGQQTVYNSVDGSMYEAYRTHYKWDVGLCVRDWRYNARIANIDSSLCESGALPDLVTLVARALRKIFNLQAGMPVIYCNRSVATGLDRTLLTKATTTSAVDLSKEEIQAGVVTSRFLGLPVHVTDSLTTAESAVS